MNKSMNIVSSTGELFRFGFLAIFIRSFISVSAFRVQAAFHCLRVRDFVTFRTLNTVAQVGQSAAVIARLIVRWLVVG